MKDLLDHFGRRADAQLQWMFNDDEVRIRSMERDADNQGQRSRYIYGSVALLTSIPSDS
jgi:hypothetical protein